MAIIVTLEISTLAQLLEISGLTIKRIAKLTGYHPHTVGQKFLGKLPFHLYQIDQFWNVLRCGGDRLVHIDRDDFIGLLPYVRPDRRVKKADPNYVGLTPRQQKAKLRKIAREGMRRLRKARREAKLANRGE